MGGLEESFAPPVLKMDKNAIQTQSTINLPHFSCHWHQFQGILIAQ